MSDCDKYAKALGLPNNYTIDELNDACANFKKKFTEYIENGDDDAKAKGQANLDKLKVAYFALKKYRINYPLVDSNNLNEKNASLKHHKLSKDYGFKQTYNDYLSKMSNIYKERFLKYKLLVAACLSIVIVSVTGIKFYASKVAEDKLDKKIAEFSSFADIDYESVSVDLLGMDVHINKLVVSIEDTKVEVRKIILKNFDQESDIPNYLNVAFEGIKIEEKITREFGLKELGYDDVIFFNFSVDYKYVPDEETLSLKRFSISSDDICKINASFDIKNIELNFSKLLFSYPEIMFASASVEYDDDSLFERLLTKESKNLNKSTEEMKKDAVSKIDREIEKEEDEFTKNSMKQIKRFIENPNKLKISAKPEKPLPFGRLIRVNDPNDLIRMLNLNIEV